MFRIFTCVLLTAILFSCKGKKKASNPDAQFFPVSTYLKGQVAQMDSSLASIIKIEKVDSISDTTYLKREEFRKSAKDFLDLPDISSDKLKGDYEVKNMYDDLLNAFIFTYETKEPANEIKKMDVILEPREDGKSEIKTINVDKWVTQGDSTVHKNMVWEAGKRFFIVTKVGRTGQPEKIRTLQVKWNY